MHQRNYCTLGVVSTGMGGRLQIANHIFYHVTSLSDQLSLLRSADWKWVPAKVLWCFVAGE